MVSKLGQITIRQKLTNLPRGLRSRLPFPCNRIFPQKIREIPGPELSGTSYFLVPAQYRHSGLVVSWSR